METKVDRFLKLWDYQKRTATVEQKNQIGMLYLLHVLKVDEKTARDFINEDEKAYHKVGMKQSAMPWDTNRKFWEEVSKIFPRAYTEEDIEWLSANGAMGPITLLCSLWEDYPSDSSVLERLKINAHVYK